MHIRVVLEAKVSKWLRQMRLTCVAVGPRILPPPPAAGREEVDEGGARFRDEDGVDPELAVERPG